MYEIFDHLMWKIDSWEKDSDADETADEMVRWHHQQ